jgi:hypothetical protein
LETFIVPPELTARVHDGNYQCHFDSSDGDIGAKATPEVGDLSKFPISAGLHLGERPECAVAPTARTTNRPSCIRIAFGLLDTEVVEGLPRFSSLNTHSNDLPT